MVILNSFEEFKDIFRSGKNGLDAKKLLKI